MANIFINFDFILKCLLALFFGSILTFGQNSTNFFANLKLNILICLGSLTFTFLGLNPYLNANIQTLVLALSIIIASFIIISKQNNLPSLELWISAGVGILIGVNFFFAALVLTLISLVLGLIDVFVLQYDQKNFITYTINAEVQQVSVLEKIEELIQKLDLRVQKKTLLRSDAIYLELTYSTSPAKQYLFLRKLCLLNGLGEILKM